MTMAQIDQEAAADELERAARLKAQADELIKIAAELEREAQDHEHDALDLIAPPTTP
jgi:hypothetical protein